MVDHLFSDRKLASLYDAFCAGRPDFDFYLPLVMSSKSVLDVGCGTGALLHMARNAGHAGRLCGIDPADGMLEQARKRSDIEWIQRDVASIRWQSEFDLAVMTGHAFQVLVSDEQLEVSLAAIRSALTPNGRFAFETRNPLFRMWEAWTPENGIEIVDETGQLVRMEHEVDRPVVGDTVSFTTTFSSPRWDRPQFSRSTLRFLDSESLSRFLTNAGFLIEMQCGDWDGSQLTETSPEVITIARPRG